MIGRRDEERVGRTLPSHVPDLLGVGAGDGSVGSTTVWLQGRPVAVAPGSGMCVVGERLGFVGRGE